MSSTDFNVTQYCGQCGTKLSPDKICRNMYCSAYGQMSSTSYPPNAPTIPVGGQQQARITQIFDNLLDDTLPASSRQLVSRPKSNKRRAIVLTVLILMLIGVTFIGIQIGKGSIPGTSTTQNTLSNNTSPNSGSPFANGNTTPTSAVLTQAPTLIPSPTFSPTPTPCPNPCIAYAENGSDNWQGWALSSDWKVVSNGLLVSTGSGNKPSAVAPYSVNGVSNFAIEAVIALPESASGNMNTGFGITACGSNQGNWQGYDAGMDVDSYGPYMSVNRTIDPIGYNQMGRANFDAGTSKHTYRLVIRGNVLTFLIDNAPIIQATDDRYLTCGMQVGLWNSNSVIQVSSFKVILL